MNNEISNLEKFYNNSIKKILEDNIGLLQIPDNKKSPELKDRYWSILQTTITTILYDNIKFDIGPFFHLYSSDNLFKTDMHIFNNVDSDYKYVFLNIDIKTVLEKDSDSKFEKICLRNSQTSIKKFRLKNREIHGLLNPFEDNLPNLSYIIKIVYDKNYNTKEIHIYCIPNGKHPKYENVFECKIQPKSKDGIRICTSEIFDEYSQKILL